MKITIFLFSSLILTTPYFSKAMKGRSNFANPITLKLQRTKASYFAKATKDTTKGLRLEKEALCALNQVDKIINQDSGSYEYTFQQIKNIENLVKDALFQLHHDEIEPQQTETEESYYAKASDSAKATSDKSKDRQETTSKKHQKQVKKISYRINKVLNKKLLESYRLYNFLKKVENNMDFNQLSRHQIHYISDLLKRLEDNGAHLKSSERAKFKKCNLA